MRRGRLLVVVLPSVTLSAFADFDSPREARRTRLVDADAPLAARRGPGRQRPPRFVSPPWRFVVLHIRLEDFDERLADVDIRD